MLPLCYAAPQFPHFLAIKHSNSLIGELSLLLLIGKHVTIINSLGLVTEVQSQEEVDKLLCLPKSSPFFICTPPRLFVLSSVTEK